MKSLGSYCWLALQGGLVKVGALAGSRARILSWLSLALLLSGAMVGGLQWWQRQWSSVVPLKGPQLLRAKHQRFDFSAVERGFFPHLNFYHLGSTDQAEFASYVEHAIPRSFREGRLWPVVLKQVLINAQKYRVDPFWVLAIIKTESGFQYRAQSHVGARGLMQLMPATAQYLKDYHLREELRYKIFKGGLDNPVLNIELGTYYLSYLLERFWGNHRLATVAYNMGPFWVLRRLRRGGPIGEKNLYFDKVIAHYGQLVRPFVFRTRPHWYSKVDNWVMRSRRAAWSAGDRAYFASAPAWFQRQFPQRHYFLARLPGLKTYVLEEEAAQSFGAVQLAANLRSF